MCVGVIAQMYCTILRLCNYSTQSQDSENAQRIFEIAQILRVHGTFTLAILQHGDESLSTPTVHK